jgi:hypothetical protein
MSNTREVDETNGGIALLRAGGTRRAVVRALAGGVGGVVAAAFATASPADAEFLSSFRRCAKCRGLSYGPPDGGACAAGGTHAPGKRRYALRYGGVPKNGQETNWTLCGYCYLVNWLPLGPSSYGGPCAVNPNGHYAGANPTIYHIDYNKRPRKDQEPGWRYCIKCKVLGRPGSDGSGPCVAGGVHDLFTSYRYNLRVVRS